MISGEVALATAAANTDSGLRLHRPCHQYADLVGDLHTHTNTVSISYNMMIQQCTKMVTNSQFNVPHGNVTEKNNELEIISTLLRQIGIPPPTVAPWREALYKDRQSNRRVGVF